LYERPSGECHRAWNIFRDEFYELIRPHGCCYDITEIIKIMFYRYEKFNKINIYHR
jgi:hypothetical protein